MKVTSDIIPISDFNKGHAATIFKAVERRPKVVVKNNVPVCVLISPAAYDSMILREEALLDEKAWREAKPMAEVAAASGVTAQDMEGWEDVEIE